MLQINYIRENKEKVLTSLKKRKFNARKIIEELLDKDENRKITKKNLDEILTQSNKLAKNIGLLFKNGEKTKANDAKLKSIELKKKSKKLNEKLNELKLKIEEILTTIPNIPHDSVPEGTNYNENIIVYENGEKPKLNLNAKPHWELAKNYNIIDFELGTKISGSGFPVYKGQGAKLQRSLINYFLDKNISAGYHEIQPPLLVNEKSGFGTGQLPDKEGQMYHVQNDNLYLIPTAEVPVTNIFRDIILDKEKLPVKYTAYTPCFRREAGSYGKDVRGLNRLHQFDKVEIVQVQSQRESYKSLDQMVEHVTTILKELELPFRVVKLCGGDMGFTSSLTFDLEVFSGVQKKWLEVSSISNFESYQSNRLKLRYKDENNKKILCHTLNGSSLALPRIIAALLENNQTDDGILIPKALIPYTGFDKIKR